MNKLEQNALRIAELLGWNPDSRYNNVYNIVIENRGHNEWLRQPQYAVVKTFSSYNGLMPIVFECNQSDYIVFTMTSTSFHVTEINTIKPMRDRLNNYQFGKSEESFIEAIQLACIKYLELKNE